MDRQFTTADDSTSGDLWNKAQFDLDTLTIDDIYNGNSDFEYMWTEMMKIMIPITILRMVPQTGNRGTEERKAEGQKIQEMLQGWEVSLPPSFMEIEPPETMMLLDTPILQHLQPLYYASLNVAVAMGISFSDVTDRSTSLSITG